MDLKGGLKININKMQKSYSSTNIRKFPILNGIDDIIRASENNIILFWSVGNGKTGLLNKLTGKNYQVADEGLSCTKDMQYDFSRICDMIIVDFPGLNAAKDFVHYLKVHKEHYPLFQLKRYVLY